MQIKKDERNEIRGVSALYFDSCVCLRGGQLCSTLRKKYL